TKYVSVDEKLATFLHFAQTGCSSRIMSILLSFHVVVKIQSRSIYSILSMLVGTFYQKHVHLLPDETPFEIKNNPKLYPYFRNCCGAIDGSHF
ncbi:hypothetical protein C8J57DRAFT_991130, partial [Mycena rebaudengoi]